MFCSIYSAHRNTMKSSNVLSKYLNEKNWNLIRTSNYYKKDYEIFESLDGYQNNEMNKNIDDNLLTQQLSSRSSSQSSIPTTTFTSKLYLSYPPPLLGSS